MIAAFTLFVASIRSWFPKAKFLESSKLRWKCVGNKRDPTLLNFVESIFSFDPAVIPKHFPANNCVLPDRGLMLTFFYRGRTELQRE